jgi:hypothetical protein
MNESQVSPTELSEGDATRMGERPRVAAVVPPPPDAGVAPTRWTAGRITALVIGGVMVLVSLVMVAGGAVALWADLSDRDSAGYVTTDVHAFSTAGSALATDPVELGNPGVDWLYSTVVLGEVRIRVTPVNPGSSTFVGIGPSAAVDRYLAGVSRTVISDFWTNRLEATGGGAPASAPGTQDFWVASTSGTGPQTLTWDPANGSWTVVVMNADGKPGVDVTADLGATMPSLIGIAVGSLVIGGVFLIGGLVLILGAIRRSRRAPNPTSV